MNKGALRILLTGCSGGGKSTLLEALERRGICVVPEPGRRIVAQERAADGRALPWVDAGAFAHRAMRVAQEDLQLMGAKACPVIFDRGVLDAAVGLDHLGITPLARSLPNGLPYDVPVLVAPPWPEIYVTDPDRPHGFQQAQEEHARLVAALDKLGHPWRELPRVPVDQRVAFTREILRM